MPEPVAYLKFWAAQSWGGSGNQDIDYGEGLATCEKEEVGDDKLPAFAVYSADQLRAAVLAERASGPNAALVEALKKLARHGEYGTATELVARAALAAVGVQHV
jgi:anti-sigma28 factor (negative regulator of flagellin synthesis)